MISKSLEKAFDRALSSCHI